MRVEFYILKYRLAANMSLDDLSDRSGVSKSVISDLEKNVQKNTTLLTIHSIAKALNKKPDALYKIIW